MVRNETISRAVTIQAPIYFTYTKPAIIVANEDKYHNANMISTFGLIENEINNLIQPALEDSQVDSQIKNKLKEKQLALLRIKDVKLII